MEQLVHSLNFYGILVESFTIIYSWKKIFSQITIATIFPLSLLSLCHAHISEHFFPNESSLSKNPKMAFCIFKVVYVVIFLALSLVSTSAVVHAVALIYTTKEAGFGEVMSMLPRVWRRVMVTFGWSLMIIFVYNVAAFSLLYPWTGSMEGPALISARVSISGLVFVIYMMGFVYMSLLWHVACVVSVLEEESGVEAMMRSKELVKGKMVISMGVFLVVNMCFMLMQVVVERFVVVEELVWRRVGWGVGCVVLLSGFTLLGLVSQTVVYFVCKLYHCEMICISSPHFENHQKLLFGDYAPLGSNHLQQLDQC